MLRTWSWWCWTGRGTKRSSRTFVRRERAFGDGHGRCARGRVDGGGPALPEWANSGAAGGEQAGARRTAGKNGRKGYEAHLRHRGSGARQENDFCMHGRDGWKPAEGRAVLRG